MNLLNLPQSVKILIAMAIGIAVGINYLQVPNLVDNAANAFVLLLQMTALPYISLSLIVGIGGLTQNAAKQSLLPSIATLVGLTSIVLMFILLAPIAFPNWENADFYSASTVKVAEEFKLVNLFIPANPFNAFANAIIPSVVLFSVFIGIGLMSVSGKKRAILVLTSLKDAVANVSSIVMKFAPIGILCIAWRSSATINIDEISGLVVYITTAFSLVLLLSFAILPALVAILTPFSYRQIIKVSREAMITAFATGSFFIVLPLIIEKAKHLIESKHSNDKSVTSLPNIIVPITFSLPVGGKLLALLFTLFAAWFSGAHISFNDYINLVVAGLPQLFGTPTLAMPHLLDLFNVSSSMFEFFLVSENLIIGRLNATLSVIFSTCVPLIVAAIITKSLKVQWRKLLVNAVVLPLAAIIVFFSLKTSFEQISYQYKGYEKFIERDFLFDEVKSKYLTEPLEVDLNSEPYSDVLTRIQERGFIRVGYFRDDLPYAFHNSEGKLVGFDIEILSQLAKDLDVDIEFVRIFHDQAEPLLSSGYLDITSGIPVIPDNMKTYTLTIPYSTQELAFIVKDDRRAEFTIWKELIDREDLIVGIPETFFYKQGVKEGFKNTTAWEISTPRLFFKEEFKHIDGMLFGAAAASAWTLIYPEYTVVVPKPKLPALSMAFPINKDDQAFELFMRNWITMKIQNKQIERLFEYWIEGKSPRKLDRFKLEDE